MKIGQHLRYFRKKKGLTQKNLAEILNITQTTYSGYETDYSEPNLETLSKLADLYDTSIDLLIGRIEIKKAVS